jgi:hypothetical protein
MPKIVVREFDYTTAPGAPYSNFAVVVPGFCKISEPTVFDDNGVYECKSQEEFITQVGLVDTKHIIEPAKAPEISTGYTKEGKSLLAAEFNTLIESGKLYEVKTSSVSENGLLKKDTYYYKKADKEKLAQGNYIFSDTETEDEESPTMFIMLDSEGNDSVEQSHYGNQIAYELLGLGYTILYKKLDRIDSLSDADF